MRNFPTIPSNGAVVTPSDSANLATPGTLFIGTGGNIKVTLVDMNDGESLTFKNLPNGCEFPRIVKRVWTTDTTASDIIVDIVTG